MICSASGQQEAVDSITGLCRVDPVPTPVPSTTTSTTMTSTSTPCAPTGVRNCTSAGCSINATNYTCMSWPPIVPVNPNAAGRLAGWDELVGLIAILCLSVGLTVLA